MDTFEIYLEKLVDDCLNSFKFAYLPEMQKKEIAQKIRNHFFDMTIDSLIDQLSEEQYNQIKDLNPDDPKMQELLSKFAAEIPGFGIVLEEKLNKEMDQILTTGQIPA